MFKRIEILGAATHAKRSHAGNQAVGKATLTLSMTGGVARLHLDLDGKDGDAVFRLEKSEALELIDGLAKLYDLQLETKKTGASGLLI